VRRGARRGGAQAAAGHAVQLLGLPALRHAVGVLPPARCRDHGAARRPGVVRGAAERAAVRALHRLRLHHELIDKGHRTPELLYNTGLLLQKTEEHTEAARFYREALDASPEFPEALLNLGIALKALGEEEEARSHWRRALKAKPELANGYFE